jgi:hypothetical protein
LLLHLPAQFEFELAQRFDHVGLEICSGGGITVHSAIGHAAELFDHFVETPGGHSRGAPLASQVLCFTQALANFCRKLAVIAPAVCCECTGIDAATFFGSQRLASILRSAGLSPFALLLAWLLTTLRSTLLSLLTLLPFLALLSLLLTALPLPLPSSLLLTSLPLPLPLTLFSSLLLSLLSLLALLSLSLLLPWLLSVLSRGVLVEPAT